MWVAFGTVTRELGDGEIVVGSGADADWRIATGELSPLHFVLRVAGQTASVRPSSTDVVLVVNGTQVSDDAQVLESGDIIAAGSARFVCSDVSPSVASPDSLIGLDAFLVDDSDGVAYPLRARSTHIGRDASNAIAIREPTASRFHAEVRREAGGFAVRSMGSAGTILNGAPLPGPRMLNEGDMIEIAFVKLRFTRDDPGAGVELAGPGTGRNDEQSRRPTFGSGRSAVEEGNLAERDTTWLKLVVAVVGLLVLAGVLWFGR